MTPALAPWGRALLLCGLAWATQVWGQTALAPQSAVSAPSASSEAPLALDLREELVRTPVTVKDLYGRQETRAMPVTIYRPAGEGPYPLVVFNHGRAVSDKRSQQGRYRPEAAVRYLVTKGFVVLVPMRVGYWENYGDFDPESTGSCNSTRPDAAAQAVFDQVMATVALAKTLPYVDASRWIVAGQSAGGATAVVTVGRAPEGLIAGLNFAGGGGGNPESNPGRPCSPQALETLWGNLAKTAKAPMLWLYWPNDRYWGPAIPMSWHKAWVQGGGQAQFPSFAASPGSDGHHGLDDDMDHWLPVVDAFLAQLGFTVPAIVIRPAPSGFAAVNDVAKVPVRPNNVQAYQRWLGQKLPRAFAVSDRGGYGSASGDYALGRALGNCRRYGGKCQLYAVDNDVVWAGK